MALVNCSVYFTKALRVGAFVVIALIISPTAAFAETLEIEAVEVVDGLHTPEAEHGGEADSHSSGGLPQLDFSTYPSQIFWVIICFSFLFLVFSRKILPDISSTIENRREHVQSDLDTAENLKENAEKARQAYEELLKDANQKALALMMKADESLKDKTNDALKSFRDKSQSLLLETEKDVEGTKTKAMKDMHDVAAEVASLAANKIIGVPADIKQAKAIIDNLYKKAA